MTRVTRVPLMEISRWKWRSREQLVQEIDARGRIRDIQSLYNLKDLIETKWWEPVLKILVMAAGVGFAVTLVHLLDRSIDLYGALQSERGLGTPIENPEAMKIALWFPAGAFSVMLIVGLLSLEVLLNRVTAMSRLHQLQMRIIDSLQAEIELLRRRLPDSPPEDKTPES